MSANGENDCKDACSKTHDTERNASCSSSVNSRTSFLLIDYTFFDFFYVPFSDLHFILSVYPRAFESYLTHHGDAISSLSLSFSLFLIYPDLGSFRSPGILEAFEVHDLSTSRESRVSEFWIRSSDLQRSGWDYAAVYSWTLTLHREWSIVARWRGNAGRRILPARHSSNYHWWLINPAALVIAWFIVVGGTLPPIVCEMMASI